MTLNAGELLTQAKAEQDSLRDELKTTLDELTYSKISETNAGIVDSSETVMKRIPTGIYVG